MANRYVSRMKRGASPGYYDNIAGIVAADAQVRSTATQERYGALASSLNSMAQSVTDGLRSFWAYDLQKETMLRERQKFELESEKLRLETERDRRRGEIEILQLQKQNTLFQMEVDNRKADVAAAPLITGFLTTVLPTLTQATLNETDPGKASEVFTKGLSDFREMVRLQTGGNPLAEARVWSNPQLASAIQSVQSNLTSKMNNTLVRDPLNPGAQYDYKVAQNALNGVDVDPVVQLSVASAVVSDPTASKFPELLAGAKKALANLKQSDNPFVRAQVELVEMGQNPLTAPIRAEYVRNITENGMDPATAIDTAIRRKDELQRTLSSRFGVGGGMASAPELSAVTSPQSAASSWAIAFDKIASDIDAGGSKYNYVSSALGQTVGPKEAKEAHAAVRDAMAEVVSQDIKALVTSSSAEGVIRALNEIDGIRSGSESTVQRIVDATDLKRVAPSDVATSASLYKPGKTAEATTVGFLLKDADMGRDYLPDTLKQIDLAQNPQALAAFATSVGLENARMIEQYQIAPAARRNFSSVLGLVLSERIADARAGKAPRSVSEIIREASTPRGGQPPFIVRAGFSVPGAPLVSRGAGAAPVSSGAVAPVQGLAAPR